MHLTYSYQKNLVWVKELINACICQPLATQLNQHYRSYVNMLFFYMNMQDKCIGIPLYVHVYN